MSYVCLWSPAWPTGAAFDADLAPALLECAPRVVVGDDNRIWIDARGLHAAQLAEQLLTVVRAHGVPHVQAGTALTPIAAECAAAHSQSTLTVVKPGTDREFIAPFLVSVLEPDEFIASLLEGLGIDTVGRFAALDAESIELRLGLDGVRLWSRARAEDDRWFFNTPIRALPSASLEWMEYALRDSERLLFVINSLLASVCAALVAQGERAREITLVFSLANKTQYTHPLRSSRPTADQKRWLRLVRDALEQLTLPDAVMGIALSVDAVTGNDGAQGDLFDRGFASADTVEIMLADLADDQGDVVVAAVIHRAPTARTPHALGRRGTVGDRHPRHHLLHSPSNHSGIDPATASAPAADPRRHRDASRSRSADPLSRRRRLARPRRRRRPRSRQRRRMGKRLRARVLQVRPRGWHARLDVRRQGRAHLAVDAGGKDHWWFLQGWWD